MFWEIEDELNPREQEVAAHLKRIGKFFVFLRKVRGDLFDEDFQRQLMTAYSPRGTDPVPPALMAMVTLLQAYDDRGDADAVVTAKLDLQWRLVLGTLEEDELRAPFGQGSLPRFRERMAAAGLLDALRERTIELARESKLFGWKQLKATLDSSPLIGAGRVEDTYNLIGHAMRDLLRHLAKVHDEPFEELAKAWGLDVLVASSVKAALDIRWEDAEERERGLRLLLEQAERLLLRTEEYLAGCPQDNEAVELAGLLLRVIDQDTDPDPDGRRSLRHGVAKDRICSVGDPEMRHGHKSESRRYDGYQRHILRGIEVPLIFGVHVQPANQAECEATEALLEQLPEDIEVTEVWCDRGYLGSHELLGMVRHGLKLHAKPWTYRGRQGKYSKDAFSIDWKAQTVECPNGVVKNLPEGGAMFRLSLPVA